MKTVANWLDKMDEECKTLCIAFNSLPGITTSESCCGHGKSDYHIWFRNSDPAKRGLLVLSRIMCNRYHKFGPRWRILLEHTDTHPQFIYLLEGPVGAFDEAEEMASLIRSFVDGTFENYNILLDK